MPDSQHITSCQLEAARALSVECPACGRALRGRPRKACSGKCRAAISRRRQAQAQAAREEDLRAQLQAALDLLNKK